MPLNAEKPVRILKSVIAPSVAYVYRFAQLGKCDRSEEEQYKGTLYKKLIYIEIFSYPLYNIIYIGRVTPDSLIN